MPKTFLESIADGYAHRSAANGTLQDTCFVFPNKRAGTFFLKALREVSPDLRFAPPVTTITDLVTELSGRIVNTRLDTLFLLHKCYCEIVRPYLTDEGQHEYLTFDAFRRWGETVLSDFNEVDIHLANPDEIFKNLFDFRSIASTFLNEEQREIIEEYFGYKVSKQYDDDRFWLDFGEDFWSGFRKRHTDFEGLLPPSDQQENPRSRFIHIWKVLAPLYSNFHAALAAKGLTTSGGSYRLAVQRLEELTEEEDNGNASIRRILPYKKMVFVGFNALSMSERRIFTLLAGLEGPFGAEGAEPFADFVWDCTGPILSPKRDKQGEAQTPEQDSARRFVAINMRDFPAPEWLLPYLRQSHAPTLPARIRAVASPSKAMEVKIAAELIGKLQKEIGREPFDSAKVAMVLPDESLLLPLLYSMPEDIGAANLTMGYPLKLTSVTSFLVLLRRMQLIRRDSSKYNGYAFEEVANLLGHPYAQAIVGSSEIRRFVTRCRRHRLSVVTDDMITTMLNEKARALLSPLPPDATPGEVIGYLDKVLSLVEEAIKNRTNQDATLRNARIERANIASWRLALARLEDAIEEYGVQLSMPGTLAEAYRLLQGENVAFEGEPLSGLQVMGTLETRALDFEHIFIVALNDRILPRKSRQRSFLPNVLRRAYGLPPVNYSESIFAYYFYRMISRAKSVTMIYDNRVSGLTGGPSRYLMQLDRIYARGRVEHMEYKFQLKARRKSGIEVMKTPEVMALLNRYRTFGHTQEKQKKLSASALKRYIQCPLKFYLQYVKELRDDPEPINSVDPITYGNLIHKVMEELLVPDPSMRGKWLNHPLEITKDVIDGILKDKKAINLKIHHFLNREYYNLTPDEIDRPLKPDTLIIQQTALNHVIKILKYDRTLTPFLLYGCEVKEDLIKYPLGDSKINMTYAIDRIDNAECGNDDATVRVVDYKTGSSHISAASIEEIFDGTAPSDHYFQLQLYSQLLNLHREQSGQTPLSVKPVIYPVTSIHKPMDSVQKGKFYPRIGTSTILLHDQQYGDTTVDEEFKTHLDEMLTELFDPTVPFVGSYDEDKCSMCAFKSICRD